MMSDDMLDVVDSAADRADPDTADAGHDVAATASLSDDRTGAAGSEASESAPDAQEMRDEVSDAESDNSAKPALVESASADTDHPVSTGEDEAAADAGTLDAAEGKSELSGIMRLYNLERDIDRKVEAYERDGKDPLDLFDPTKPDYLGTPEALAPYMPGTPLRLTVHPKGQDEDATAETTGEDQNPDYGSAPEKGNQVSQDAASLSDGSKLPASPHLDAFETAAAHLARAVVHDRQRPEYKPDKTTDNGSFVDQLTQQLSDRLQTAGIPPAVAVPLTQLAVSAASNIPVISTLAALHDLPNAVRSHDPIDVLLAAAALLPGGRLASSLYREARAIYFLAYPALRGKVWVYHAIPLHVLNKYPKLFTVAEIQSLSNLRGIPNEINRDIHLKALGSEWRSFYKENEIATKERIFQKVQEIDEVYGHLFMPRQGSAR